MALTEKDVRYVAELAHLELSETEVSSMQPQLSAILDYVQSLNEVDTSRIEPMAQFLAAETAESHLRLDKPAESLPRDQALASAPDTGAGCFRVPSVIERE